LATTATFRALCADSPDTLTTVARFLALLELFGEGAVAFEQVTALGELNVRWTGSEEGEIEVTDEFDKPIRDRDRPVHDQAEGDDR
jgi:segregation and condensation protein A